MEDYSTDGLVHLLQEGKRAQLLFLDGSHYFEGYLSDIAIADRLLDVGGFLIVNDTWLPAVRAIGAYVSRNFAHYKAAPGAHENVLTFQKVAKDSRAWDSFVPFDGSGRKSQSFWSRFR